MESTTTDTHETKDIFIYRHQLEQNGWMKRGSAKLLEVTAFIGVSIATTPFWHMFFVIGMATVMVLTFLFQYEEWYKLTQFHKVFYKF